nr:transposase (putative), gypsy type [Tanacetum cinerariifolium]
LTSVIKFSLLLIISFHLLSGRRVCASYKVGSIDDIKSTLTQSALDALCEKFHIPDIVHSVLHGRNNRICNSLTDKIGVYIKFFDFANYRIPLSQFLVDVLEYFEINLSHLSVIVAAKVSHFEILCRIHSFVSTLGNFRKFYINSKNKGWMSFSKRFDTAQVCYTKPLDSLKHRNDNFFWVDSSAFLLSIPWHNNKTLRKDPHPTSTEFDAKVCDFVANHPAPFLKFSESFLCLIGISRYYELDDNVYLIILVNDDGEDLFAFINHADPTKVRICEREVKEGENDDVEDAENQNDDVQDARNNVIEEGAANGQEIPFDAGIVRIEDEVPSTAVDKSKGTRKKRKASSGASGSALPPKRPRDDHDTSGDVGVTPAVTIPFTTSFVTPTPERESGGRTDFIFGPNLQTQHPAGRSSVPPPLVLTAAVAINAIIGAAFAPVHESSTRPVQRSIFRDSASPSTVGAEIIGSSQPTGAENVINDSAFDDPEVCQTHQACFSAEVKLRSEYSYRERKKFESKCQRQVDLLKEKDTVANLKARLSLNVAEVVEAIRLRNQVAAIEGMKAARLSCDELSIKDASLESEKDKLTNQVSSLETICSGLRDQVSGYELFKEQIKAVQDEHVKVLTEQRWIIGRGLRPVVMKCLKSPEYIATLGGAIGRAIDKVGEARTSGVLAVAAATNALSTIAVQASFVPSIPVSNYEVADTEAQAEASSSLKITFKQEILETSPENPTT